MMPFGTGYNLFGPMRMDVLYWLTPFILLDLVLKAVALWRAARHNQVYWFIALLFLNTLGILPLVYLLVFEKQAARKHTAA